MPVWLAYWRARINEIRADAAERRSRRWLHKSQLLRARAANLFQRLGLSE